MKKAGFPFWVYPVAAAIIAAGGFVVGGLFPGLGVAFVAGGATLWTVVSVSYQRKMWGGHG